MVPPPMGGAQLARYVPGGLGAPPPPSGPVPGLVGPCVAGPGAIDLEDEGPSDGRLVASCAGGNDKKPRIFLLIARLALDVEEEHIQQLLEQCGEVQAWRRARDNTTNAPLSFGFVQFNDPEAAWKTVNCLSKRKLKGQEIKVMVEESGESVIAQWRQAQQVALKVRTVEELDWELERKSVSCKAAIEAKVEELYGPQEGATLGGGANAQRRQELREKEQARIERVRKRKAWRDQEFAKELARVEGAEKRLRKSERDADDADRVKEEKDNRGKVEPESKVAKLEEGYSALANLPQSADSRKLMEMVDRVQSESRDQLFKLPVDASFLRGEKVLETKLRPWLERKVELFMGGPQADLVEYILRRVNGVSLPDTLISDLTRFLDDNAEPLVERMWRMLAFELMRGGVALTPSLKKEKKEFS